MAHTFGSRKYREGVYGGQDTTIYSSSIAIYIEVYNSLGARKGTIQSGVGTFLGCEFTHDENGCRDFALYFASFQNLGKKDRVKIKLFNSLDYFYTGVIREIPIQGSTKQEYNYSGYGLNDYLHRINAESQIYAAQTLQAIVDDLVDNIITVKTPITKDASKIILPNITIDFNSNYMQMIDALNYLKEIASSDGNFYIFGVDQTGAFYIRQKSYDLKTTLIVGKKGRYGISAYEPNEDNTPKTKFFVLDKDGVYVTTINTTDTDNDINEEKITAPDIDNATIALWAQGKMVANEISNKRASIEWRINDIDPLTLFADGTIRIISNIPSIITVQSNDYYGEGNYGSGLYGGEQYAGYNLDDILEVKQVKYVVNSNQAIRQIELGNLPVRLDDQMLAINKKVNDLKISLSM